MRKILGQEASCVCGSWFRKIQKIEDVAEGKLMCLGLLGWGGAEGTVRLGNPEWETWLGSAGAQELLWVVLQDRELLWAALALDCPQQGLCLSRGPPRAAPAAITRFPELGIKGVWPEPACSRPWGVQCPRSLGAASWPDRIDPGLGSREAPRVVPVPR